MKESIMSFYNAPITNQVPNGVVSIDQLYTYVSTNEWLRERTVSHWTTRNGSGS